MYHIYLKGDILVKFMEKSFSTKEEAFTFLCNELDEGPRRIAAIFVIK